MNIRSRYFKVLRVIVPLAMFVAMWRTLMLPYQLQIRQKFPAAPNYSFTTSKQPNKVSAQPIRDGKNGPNGTKPSGKANEIAYNTPKDELACKPAREIVYLKTHKTGSTTLKTILLRHVATYNLTDMVPGFPAPFYGGYPGRLRKEFCFIQSPNNQKKASVLIGHFRFQEESVKEIMNPNARYISIMRNPLDASRSSFYYYYTIHPIRVASCPAFPYIHVLKSVGKNFSEFLAAVSPSTILESPMGFRAKNFQAHDFGLDPYNESVEYVLAEAKKLDQTFDLVLILEHLLESLVLLKDILCTEWSNVIPGSVRVGHYISQQLSAREQYTINQLTTQDRILYNYFNESLWRKIEKYGRERMKNDVEKLRKIGGLNGRKSTHSNEGRDRQVRMVTFKESAGKQDMLSDLGSRLEKQYHIKPISPVEDKQIFYKLADYMIENNGWCPEVH